ncbi:MAG: hypothetical protein WAM91_12550 [Candidatus Acidiferrales bacterium]
MTTLVQCAAAILGKLDVAFPEGGPAMEQIVLRWVHIFAGIAWVGSIYYTAVVAIPAMMKLDPTIRGRAMLSLMPRSAWLGRFGAAVTWLAGFRYFMIYAQSDAVNAGDPSLAWRWIGIWFACWVVAFGIFMGALQMGKLSGAVLGVLAGIVTVAAAWANLALIAGPATSNKTLCISIGGGIGTMMFLAAWGIVWRCQKKLIRWTRAAVENGTPMPAEAAQVQRMLAQTITIGCWLTIPLLFFMEASSHFPFLSGK